MFLPLLFLSSVLLKEAISIPESGIQIPRKIEFNENYTVEWQANFDEKTIVFNITAKTTGFVGFGLSRSGGMEGGDIVIGGVLDNGTSYFGDYHGIGSTAPVKDSVQNWELISSYEENGVTFLQVKRLLDTCDATEDIKIADGTLKFIWSLGQSDVISYHGANRGSKSVQALYDQPQVDLTKYEKFEIRQNYTSPTNSDTKYWCTLHKRQASKKSHIVAFKPILETPEALALTHHYQVLICRPPPGGPPAEEVYEPWVGFGEDCNQWEVQIPREYCLTNLYSWSVGGEILAFPENIGVPWGEYENEYFLFNVHINNPELVDTTFEAGVSIYYTEELREIEAGFFEVFHNYHPSLVIPPDTKDWMIVGHCSSGCTEASFDPEGINIITVDLHAHISGRSIKVRHFRNGTELPWIMRDMSYDFNYQEFRTPQSPIKVLPGDAITVECVYDSTWKSPPGAVIGGFSSFDEMCNMYSYYYPRKEIVKYCGGVYPVDWVLERYGVTNYTIDFPEFDPLITEPEHLAGIYFSELMTSHVNWTAAEKESFQQELRYGLHTEACSGPLPGSLKKGPRDTLVRPSDNTKQTISYIGYPEFDQDYEEPSTCSPKV